MPCIIERPVGKDVARQVQVRFSIYFYSFGSSIESTKSFAILPKTCIVRIHLAESSRNQILDGEDDLVANGSFHAIVINCDGSRNLVDASMEWVKTSDDKAAKGESCRTNGDVRWINTTLLHAVDGDAKGGDISEHGVTEKNTIERVGACN
jgi:hypothetical protein